MPHQVRLWSGLFFDSQETQLVFLLLIAIKVKLRYFTHLLGLSFRLKVWLHALDFHNLSHNSLCNWMKLLSLSLLYLFRHFVIQKRKFRLNYLFNRFIVWVLLTKFVKVFQVSFRIFSYLVASILIAFELLAVKVKIFLFGSVSFVKEANFYILFSSNLC